MDDQAKRDALLEGLKETWEALERSLQRGRKRHYLTSDQALACVAALEVAEDFFSHEFSELLQRIHQARSQFDARGNPRDVIRALGWGKKQGQQYDPAAVVALYHRLTTPGPRLLILSREAARHLDDAEGKTVSEVRRDSEEFAPPLPLQRALWVVKNAYGFNSLDSAWQHLKAHGQQLGVDRNLPARPRRSR